MDDFTRKFITEWRKLDLPFKGETFLVAVSGGADSCALAEVLKELQNKKKLTHRFVVVHFDHLLRGDESAQDAAWVAEFAEKLGFEFVAGAPKKGEINAKANVEQTARTARYRFLCETFVRMDAWAILLGHTINDQAETLLLNLIRGSGLKGLSGMPAIRSLSQSNLGTQVEMDSHSCRLIRPMLNWAKREDTENFAKKQNVAFRQDSMNDNRDIKRVQIRKELIPTLSKYNPDIVGTLARTAQILGDESLLLEQYEANGQANDPVQKEKLSLSDLRTLSDGELNRFLRRWLSHHRGGLRKLENKHVENIASLINSRKSGRKIELPGGELVIKQKGELFFRQTKVEK